MSRVIVRGAGEWELHLICCGHLNSIERFATWDEADAWRENWYDVDGHWRVAILRRGGEQKGLSEHVHFGGEPTRQGEE